MKSPIHKAKKPNISIWKSTDNLQVLKSDPTSSIELHK